MRLLRLEDHGEVSLVEFAGRNIPRYAILSHTWGKDNEEVTFKDLVNGTGKSKAGYSKIRFCRQQAAHDGLQFFWVDTCCIDKSSSSELTEAINSMYRWYKRSEVCYVFLSDLTSSASLDTTLQKCRWVTRGWTLQELIAPGKVHFFDEAWNHRGSKSDIVELLSKVTGINSAILRHEQHLSSIAVAQKMSWAAHRETTRIEDTAYCLLGIFDINMPLLYGEEEKAFRRLQEEIIKSVADFSIFAWRMPSPSGNENDPETRVFCGVLAETPSVFARSTSITRELNYGGREFSISNNGVKTQIQILVEPIPGKKGYRYVLPLDCYWAPQKFLGVRLRKCGPEQYIREDPWNFVESIERFYPNSPTERYLLTKLPEMNLRSDSLLLDRSLFIAQTRSAALQIKRPPEVYIYDGWPWGRFDDEDQLFFVTGNSSSRWDAGALKLGLFFTFPLGRHNIDVGFECMFYAAGWSDPKVDCLQCTLVDYQLFSTALDQVQSQIVTWDHDRRQVLNQLAYHKIPKCSSTTFEIPGTKASALFSFTSALVHDSSICQNEFWRIEFFYKVYEAKDLPQIRNGEWNLEED